MNEFGCGGGGFILEEMPHYSAQTEVLIAKLAVMKPSFKKKNTQALLTPVKNTTNIEMCKKSFRRFTYF